jgi:hypothetical protein
MGLFGITKPEKPWQFTKLYCTNTSAHHDQHHDKHRKKNRGEEEVLAAVLCYECNLYLCDTCHKKIHSGKSHGEHIIATDPLRAYIVTKPAPANPSDVSHIHRHLKNIHGLDQFQWKWNNCESLYDTFRAAVNSNPQHPMLGHRYIDVQTKQIAMSYEWESYGDVYKRCDNFSAGLVKLGLSWKSNDTIGLYSINRPEWTIAEFASYFQSLAPVPLYDTVCAI